MTYATGAAGGRGRVRRLLLPLADGVDPGDGAPAAADIHRRDRRHQPRDQRPRHLMKWPFARHTNTPSSPGQAPADGSVGSTTTTDPTRPEVSAAAPVATGQTRRDWATLPPLKVAGGRPISLTVHAREFTKGLVTQQVLVHNPRLEHVRQIDAPSGSFRGVLAPAVVDHGGPELQEASPLPSIEHRHAPRSAASRRSSYGQAAIDHLLSIGAPEGGVGAPAFAEPIEPSPAEAFEPPTDGSSPGRRHAGLADSRRMGLGPAYHGPLPEAMRAERDRDDSPDGGGGVSAEAVPGDVRATMRDILGVDVGDRLVHRGPSVSAEADAMGAQAFTRDGQIYVHDDVGPLDQPRGRATVAHELTHAAQQMVHNALHDEATEVGQALEAHAQRRRAVRARRRWRDQADSRSPSRSPIDEERSGRHGRGVVGAADDA